MAYFMPMEKLNFILYSISIYIGEIQAIRGPMKPEEYVFTEEEITNLRNYRDHQDDIRLRQRFIALLMLAEGQNREFIKSVLGASSSSVNQWFNQFHQKGANALNSFQYKPKESYLSKDQTAELTDWVKKKAR